MPELLIGAAVDVVVRGADSFVGTLLGVDSRFAQLGWITAVNTVVWILESVFGYLAAVLWRNLAQSVEHDLRVDAYDHAQHLDVGWHENRRAGGTLAILNDDVNQLERFLDLGADRIIRTALNIVLVGAVFAASSLAADVAGVPADPGDRGGIAVVPASVDSAVRTVREAVAELSSTLSANLGGISTIKAFTAERRERERVETASLAYRQANMIAIRSSAAFIPLIRMAILAGFSTTLLLGGWAVLAR